MADNAANINAFVGRLSSAGKGVESSKKSTLNTVALAAKTTLLAVPSTPRFLRGVGSKGAKVGVRYRLVGDTAYVRFTGPAHLVNNPTRAHPIQPRRRRGKRAVSYGDQAYARVQHPGTRGKRFFQIGKAIVQKEAPLIWRKQQHAELARHFKET